MRSSLFCATIVVVTCALFVVVNVSGQVTSGDYGIPLTPPRWKYTNAMEVIAASLLDFRMAPSRRCRQNGFRPGVTWSLSCGAGFILKFEFLDGKWKNGRIYNPVNGKDYEAELELESDVLKVRD